jgi:hypothetical protein
MAKEEPATAAFDLLLYLPQGGPSIGGKVGAEPTIYREVEFPTPDPTPLLGCGHWRQVGVQLNQPSLILLGRESLTVWVLNRHLKLVVALSDDIAVPQPPKTSITI